MKKYILTFVSILLAWNAGAQLFSPMGKGIYGGQFFSASNGKDRIASFSQKGSGDTVEIKLYNTKTKTWKTLNDKDFYYWQFGWINEMNVQYVAFSDDTLYVHCIKPFVYGQKYIFKVFDNKINDYARVKFSNFKNSSKILHINNRLLVVGEFDSIYFNGQWKLMKNQAYLDNNTWKPLPFREPCLSDLKVIGDTIAYIDHNKKLLKRYTLAGFKDSFALPAGRNGFNLNELNGRFLISTNNWDSVFFISGKTVVRSKINIRSTGYFQVVGKGDSVILKPGNGSLYRWNTKTNTLLRIYINSRNLWRDSSFLLHNTDSGIVLGVGDQYGAGRNILYGGADFGKIALIDLNAAKSFGFDTIYCTAFHDKNKDLIFNGSDELLTDVNIYNEQFGYTIQGTNRTDTIPDYMECDYNVSDSYDNCLKLSFTGTLRSGNLRIGKTRDTLFFPYQEFVFFNNKYTVDVRSYSTPRHRLRSISQVDFAVRNSVCTGFSDKMVLKILPPPNCTIVSTTPAATKVVNDTLIFNFKGSYNKQDYFSLYVTYDTLKYNMGDTVTYKAWVFTETPEDPSDNYTVFRPVLVYSYDPNRKYSLPEGRVTKQLKQIQYHIDFENEGNDYAERVIIKDTLDTRVPVYAFQMVKASHPYTVSLQGNVVTWVFDNIMLAAKKQDSVKSKGYVNFVAMINSSVREGDSIRNRASIYFDYNKPIITNFAVILFPQGSPGSVNSISSNAEWRVFPNPANDVIRIDGIKGKKQFNIYNSQGRMVYSSSGAAGSELLIDVQKWSRGLYLITDSDGNSGKLLLQ